MISSLDLGEPSIVSWSDLESGPSTTFWSDRAKGLKWLVSFKVGQKNGRNNFYDIDRYFDFPTILVRKVCFWEIPIENFQTLTNSGLKISLWVDENSKCIILSKNFFVKVQKLLVLKCLFSYKKGLIFDALLKGKLIFLTHYIYLYWNVK